jgi:hypothetical protein
MSATSAAFEAGDLDTPVVDLLAAARERHPDVFGEHESGLVEGAAQLTPRDASRLIAYWRQALDHHDALVSPS